jgi:hypothetical protein
MWLPRKALASIRGLALEVAVTDGSFGRLMIHFNGDATVLAPGRQVVAARNPR